MPGHGPDEVLAFSDLRRDRDRAQRLVELAREADVVVGAGDYATMRMGLEGTLEILSALERKRPVLAVCGQIHQCWGGEAGIGTTPVVNLGPEGRLFEV